MCKLKLNWLSLVKALYFSIFNQQFIFYENNSIPGSFFVVSTSFAQCDGRYESEIFSTVSVTEVEYTDVYDWGVLIVVWIWMCILQMEILIQKDH